MARSYRLLAGQRRESSAVYLPPRRSSVERARHNKRTGWLNKIAVSLYLPGTKSRHGGRVRKTSWEPEIQYVPVRTGRTLRKTSGGLRRTVHKRGRS